MYFKVIHLDVPFRILKEYEEEIMIMNSGSVQFSTIAVLIITELNDQHEILLSGQG